MSRQVDFMFVDLSLAVPQIQGGKLKALGVTTPSRFSIVPDIPALNESGAQGYQLVVWFALAGPAGMPKPVVDRLSASLKQALASKKLQDKYASHGLEVKPSTPDEFGTFLKSEIASWGDSIRKAGIAPQD
jgi:tripartite-type tricarboxylate transporter receptor subunit TctC